jgi:N-acetylmuramoyl-L-alanine amidase CwlA
MNIKKDLSPNYTAANNSVVYYGVPRSFKHIVLHWWGDPKDKPTLSGTVNYLKTPASQVSAHYVVSEKEIVQLVEEENIAWHAKQANPISIGIEIDPRLTDTTYETVAWLVRDICNRRKLPIDTNTLKGHREFVATACPGILDISRVISLAKAGMDLKIDIPSDVEEKYKLKEFSWYSKYWTWDEFILDSIKTHQKYDALKDKNSDLEKRITSLENTINLQVNEIKSKSEQIDVLQETVTTLGDQLRNIGSEMKSKALEYEEVITSLKTDKDSLESIVGSLEATISDSTKKIEVLEGKVEKLREKVSKGLDGYTVWELIKQILRR